MMKFFITAATGMSVIASGGCAMKDSPPLVAHRGNSSVAPENTMAAYEAAWLNGFNCIEIDVYQSADDVAFCCHDGNLSRVSPGASDKRVTDMTWEELQQYDVGAWKSPEFAGAKIPSLEELFARMPDDVKIFLEIKSVKSHFPHLLTDLMAKYGITRSRISIISFDADAIRNMNSLAPGFKTSLLMGIGADKEDPSLPAVPADDLIAMLRELGATGIDANVAACVDREYIRKVQDAGFEFHVWTIDSPEEAGRLRAAGVDSITTNCPAVIYESFK